MFGFHLFRHCEFGDWNLLMIGTGHAAAIPLSCLSNDNGLNYACVVSAQGCVCSALGSDGNRTDALRTPVADHNRIGEEWKRLLSFWPRSHSALASDTAFASGSLACAAVVTAVVCDCRCDSITVRGVTYVAPCGCTRSPGPLLLAKHSPSVLLAHFIGDAGRRSRASSANGAFCRQDLTGSIGEGMRLVPASIVVTIEPTQ
jgi:hypothetical protein